MAKEEVSALSIAQAWLWFLLTEAKSLKDFIFAGQSYRRLREPLDKEQREAFSAWWLDATFRVIEFDRHDPEHGNAILAALGEDGFPVRVVWP